MWIYGNVVILTKKRFTLKTSVGENVSTEIDYINNDNLVVHQKIIIQQTIF